MGLSEIRNRLENSIKNKSLNIDIDEIFNCFGSLEEIAYRLKFIDSIEPLSFDSHNTLKKVIKKRREENEID